MARLFDATQFERLLGTAVITANSPLAFVVWFNISNVTDVHTLLAMCSDTTDTQNMALFANTALAGDPVTFQMNSGGAWEVNETTTGVTVDTWHHAAGIWVPGTESRVFIDGGSKNVIPSAVYPTRNRTGIGALPRLTPGAYTTGAIAEVAIYHLAYFPGPLNTDRADQFEKILPSLAAGFSPLNFPLGLAAYWPLHRLNGAGDDEDIIGGYDMTPVNAPTWADHPGVIMPQRSQLTEPRSVLPSFGKFRTDPMLTGKMRTDPNLTGKLKTEPYTIGKLGINTGV